MGTWTRDHLRHARTVLFQGRNPAATVYDSIGQDFFLALDEGWLNLGLWEGDGTDVAEAPLAVRRLVAELAVALPKGADLLDVGNGLGAQDPLIAQVAAPARLIALNITHSQLVAGRVRLTEAGALPVNGDATRMPFRDAAVDGVVSVEAAFHFPSRARFFREAFRVLRPGGTLSMSDVVTNRTPRGPRELVAGLGQLRVWGLRTTAAVPAERLRQLAERAGFVDVEVRPVGERVIAPALRFVRRRLDDGAPAPIAMRLAARALLGQLELLWERGVVDYVLIRASRPGSGRGRRDGVDDLRQVGTGPP
ncbi:MAG TPA: methyltransferase domain-containing protein [Actinomycetota bacterium]|nr:methyltransferase domain-containing protein [Actinomycetota bacterium]